MIILEAIKPRNALFSKDVRLRALRDAPTAFSSTYQEFRNSRISRIDRLPLRRTDVKQRVLDPMKHPVALLYVAGEISSIYGHLYMEAGNITECFVAGKIAGQNAAAELPWG